MLNFDDELDVNDLMKDLVKSQIIMNYALAWSKISTEKILLI